MCSRSATYLPALPVEILHHIFDQLDPQTIILGLSRTCQRLRSVVRSYDRYQLDFHSLSKSDFKLMCHLVDPHAVTSLRLSLVNRELDHIELFLSLFETRQLSRLRTLELSAIFERQLGPILKSIHIRSLTSLLVHVGNYDGRRYRTTAKFIASAIAQTKLRRLEISFNWDRLERIVWSNQTLLQYLSIDNCLSMDEIYKVLPQLPCLQTLVLKDVDRTAFGSWTTLFPQITSLTFTDAKLPIDRLEMILSLMPSLSYLKVIGGGNYLDGDRWEHFLQAKLPLLKRFEFFFKTSRTRLCTPADLELIVAPYRTPFWLEQKRCFVTCEYSSRDLLEISLYSSPICVSSFKYVSESTKTSLSTGDTSHGNPVTMMDNVSKFQIDFKTERLTNAQPNEKAIHSAYFRHVRKLHLEFGVVPPSDWVPFVSTLIDLRAVVELKLTGPSIRKANPAILVDVATLLQGTCNLSSLDLFDGFYMRTSGLTSDQLCPMIPRHVKRLATPVKNLGEIEKILDRLENLSSVNFSFAYVPRHNRDIDWLLQKKAGSTYEIDSFSLVIWLKNSNLQSTSTEVPTKRMKLTHDEPSTSLEAS